MKTSSYPIPLCRTWGRASRPCWKWFGKDSSQTCSTTPAGSSRKFWVQSPSPGGGGEGGVRGKQWEGVRTWLRPLLLDAVGAVCLCAVQWPLWKQGCLTGHSSGLLERFPDSEAENRRGRFNHCEDLWYEFHCSVQLYIQNDFRKKFNDIYIKK